MVDYRKLYAETFDITWDHKEFEVHHIDCNRDNNEIDNLILIPKKLHSKLHSAMSKIAVLNTLDPLFLKKDASAILNGYSSYSPHVLKKYYDALSDCSYWGILKRMDYHYCDGRKMTTITSSIGIWEK